LPNIKTDGAPCVNGALHKIKHVLYNVTEDLYSVKTCLTLG